MNRLKKTIRLFAYHEHFEVYGDRGYEDELGNLSYSAGRVVLIENWSTMTRGQYWFTAKDKLGERTTGIVTLPIRWSQNDPGYDWVIREIS